MQIHKSRTAFLIFHSFFCDKIEFESPGATTKFFRDTYKFSRLSDDKEADNNKALSPFASWCEGLLEYKEADEDNHVEYLDADTQ